MEFSAQKNKKQLRIVEIIDWGNIALQIEVIFFSFLIPAPQGLVTFRLACSTISAFFLGLTIQRRFCEKDIKFWRHAAWDSMENNVQLINNNEKLIKTLTELVEGWKSE